MQSPMSAGYELSPQQKLFFERGRESATAGLAILLEGPVDAGKVRGALQQLVDRHEILRTCFQRRTGMKFPFQLVQETALLSWEELDLVAMAPAAQRLRIQELLGDSSRIDIERGPVLVARLATLGAGKHALLLTCSALCVDDASLNRFFSDFSAIYAGTALAEDVLQYADYSEWQHETLHKDDNEAKQAARFWQQLKIESIPALSLPFEHKAASSAHGWATVQVDAPAGNENFLL